MKNKIKLLASVVRRSTRPESRVPVFPFGVRCSVFDVRSSKVIGHRSLVFDIGLWSLVIGPLFVVCYVVLCVIYVAVRHSPFTIQATGCELREYEFRPTTTNSRVTTN